MAFAPKHMTGVPLHGQRINYADPQSRQQALAYQLMQEGASTAPVHTPLQGLARALQAGVGGYFSNQADERQKAKDAEKAAVMAQALLAGQGTPAAPPPTLAGGEAAATRGTGAASVATPGDPNKMAQILMGNPELAPMGMQLGLQQIQYGQQKADAQKATEASQNFQKEMTRINQAFQSGQLTQQQAHAAQLQAQAQAHAAGMQGSAQNFTAGQNAAQQTFQGQQNQLNRDAQAAQQQAAAALAKVPTGYQVNPQGGIAPIPGSPQATEAADTARAKEESGASVERMIRSIDELAAHPGLEGTVGISFGQRHIPGTDAASFDSRLETLKSQAFLPMVAQLKGMGQLSDAEGKKLTAAIGALDPKMSEKEFKASMATIRADMNVARKRMGLEPIPEPEKSAPKRQTQGTRLKYNPATGELE